MYFYVFYFYVFYFYVFYFYVFYVFLFNIKFEIYFYLINKLLKIK